MRNAKGQFVKGQRASPATEFKPGQHWRSWQPFRDKEWLQVEYVDKERSLKEIAEEFGVTVPSIRYWMDKYGIRRRTMHENRQFRKWNGGVGEGNGMYGKRGAESAAWKGGCTPERQAFYNSREWAVACVEVWGRDKSRCVRCGVSRADCTLHVHHVVSFAVKELRAEPSNMVLLCEKCHKFVHSKKNTAQEFIRDMAQEEDAS